jgi:hypothetical protein
MNAAGANDENLLALLRTRSCNEGRHAPRLAAIQRAGFVLPAQSWGDVMRFWSTTFVFVLASAALLLTARGRIEEPMEVSGVSGYVCAVYKTAEYPDYCKYYAFQCSSSTMSPCSSGPVPLSKSNCMLTRGDCCNPMGNNNCFLVSTFDVVNESYVDGKIADDGLKQPLDEKFEPKLFDAKIIHTQIAEIELPDKKTTIKAKLFQILCTKDKIDGISLPVLIMGDGVEIKTDKPADIKIKSFTKTVEFDRKVCYLNLGNVEYTVVLSKEVKPAQKK